MKLRNKIYELDEEFIHLQERMDNLRDYVKDNPKADYYWDKFEDLLAWSLKFDGNSIEYHKLSYAAWNMLDLYMDKVLVIKPNEEIKKYVNG